MTEIYVDADACPVKDEVIRVAERHGLVTHLVSDGGIRPYPSTLVRLVFVTPGVDAADDWIAQQINSGDIAITNDIPLAGRCLKKGARAVRADGKMFTEASIGMAMAMRDVVADLRERGEITGGPPPFSKRDRSRFLQTLETVVQSTLKL